MTAYFTDAGSGTWYNLQFSAVENGQTKLPSWISFDNTTQAFTINATSTSVATTVDIKAIGAKGLSVTCSVVITPTANVAPTLVMASYTESFTPPATPTT